MTIWIYVCISIHFWKHQNAFLWILDFTYSTSFGDHRTINLPNCSFSIFQLLLRFEAIGQRIIRSASLSESLIQNIQKCSRESNVFFFQILIYISPQGFDYSSIITLPLITSFDGFKAHNGSTNSMTI